MNSFDKWWSSVYADRPKHIHRQCFEEGYDQGYADGVTAVRILKSTLIGLTALVAVIFIFKIL